MDVDAAVAMVKQRLGNRSDAPDAQILLELVLAQAVFEEGILTPQQGIFLPWFLITEFSSISTTIGEERVPIPSDFLQEVEQGQLYVYDSAEDDAWIELEKADDDTMRANPDLVEATGKPEAYSLTNGYFRLLPVPDAVYTLKMMYYKQDTVPVAAGPENLWLKHAPDLMVAQTCIQMGQNLFLTDNRLALFRAQVQVASERLYIKNEARKHANRSYVMGGLDG